MSVDLTFRDLVRRVRAGDAQASTELVRRYEPALRLAVRARLTDPGLRRLLDSVDICQSVLASFFLRAAAGQYELDEPRQLLKLLATMARNKLVKQVEKQRAARRDYRREQHPLASQLVASDPSPGDVAAQHELLIEFRNRLTPEELALAELRASGHSWPEIAAVTGDHPDSARIRLQRAVDRVMRELGLDERFS